MGCRQPGPRQLGCVSPVRQDELLAPGTVYVVTRHVVAGLHERGQSLGELRLKLLPAANLREEGVIGAQAQLRPLLGPIP